MDTLSFQLSTYSIEFANQQLTLLPKEFDLLHFLYRHPNQVFSRDKLLDAVWGEGTPTDRTVDDHIYRVRKKLGTLKSGIKINTFRGQGYCLIKGSSNEKTLKIEDPQFEEISESLLYTYHLYGNGQAIKSLLNNPAFGIEPPSSLRMPLAFMAGDYRSIIYDSSISFKEKSLFLLWVNLLLEGAKPACEYFNQVYTKQLFTPLQQPEFDTLSRILFLLLSRNFDKALEAIVFTEGKITSSNDGFYPFFRITKLMYAICMSDQREIDEEKALLKVFFTEKPYLREKGIFLIVTGIKELIETKKRSGLALIEEGIEIVEHSQFNSHMGLAIAIMRFFLEKECTDEALQLLVTNTSTAFFEPHQIEKLKKEIKSIFHRHL
ncbi:winged helix-turn-helix domain-containing protein [Alkalihalophilus pseudofirmus]|uniref:winged helix-turn-helix domain-containing protein n=1 Tax=Alkalihalophilus pseudofirmus TaxID=79885 RepID=UPI00259B82FD|nr:winged helix-turn-helix domain-containing protein [Alkalihalophilus pseudofirmus]WEG17888.1 winged helix-turn-helix domain-containing protein [Alkalihalophilus pseudofirmus]